MRGAIYSRVSTEIQDYGKQTDELKDYAARNNIEVKYIFEEKVSGFKDDRTEFKKLEKLTKNDIIQAFSKVYLHSANGEEFR